MTAKAKPYQPPVAEDDDECDCPKCPPVGAPAWLATFADIATNLMAFFVLILGFAQFDEPAFSKFAGAMRDQFGRVGLPGAPGELLIDLNPVPQPDESVMDRSAPGDGAERDGAEKGEAEKGGAEGAGTGPGGATAEAVAQALQAALAAGAVTVQSDSGSVTIRLKGAGADAAARDLARLLAEAAEGGGAPQADPAPEAGADPAGGAGTGAGTGAETGAGTGAQGAEAGRGGAAGHETGITELATLRGRMTEARLIAAFAEDIRAGTVKVGRDGGRVIITLGAGGSFASGSAELTDEARRAMALIARASDRPNRRITVTGHTDDRPIRGGAYPDNLSLAAARAEAVVRELVETGRVDPARITAASRGEFAPVADNATEEGRARNRRIEIEIGFDG